MNQEYAELLWDDLEEIDAAFTKSSRRVLIPFRWPTDDCPQFHCLKDVPTEEFAWWFPDESPPFQVAYTSLKDYCLEWGSEVILCSRIVARPGFIGDGVTCDWDEMTRINPDEWVPQTEEFVRHIAQLKQLLNSLCVCDPEGVRYSRRVIEEMLRLPSPPEWVSKALKKKTPKRKSAVGGGRPGVRLMYDASFEVARSAIGLGGAPQPGVARRPSYDDEKPGPGLFRAAVMEQGLENLTLPGLYIGRSEVVDVCWCGSDLHLSSFHWSDFERCDFSGCDLHDSDLRACNFRDCNFRGADLRECDLRGSGFEGCDFTNARLDGALLLDSPRGELALSAEQQAAAKWTSEYEEPPGG